MNKTLRNTSGLALFGIMSAVFLLPAAIVLAADGVTSYIPLVSVPGLFTAGTATNPVELIKGIYGLAIGIGSVIATVMIIYAGFEYMYVESMGQKSAAKERIQNAFWGLLVILGSYILLRTINPSLVEFNITLPAGTGRLGQLVAADQAALKREKAISDALKADAAAKAEIAALQGNVSSIDARIETLRKQQVGVATTSPAFRDAQVTIDALSAEKQRVQSQVNEKTIQSTSEILSVLLREGQDNVITNEINALGTAGLGYTSSQAFDTIIGRKGSTLARLENELTKIKALPETPNKAELVRNFEQSTNLYKGYVNTSRTMFDEIDKALYVPPSLRGLNIAQMKSQDDRFKLISASTENSAKSYEASGNPELANQLRSDLKNGMTIVKTVLEKTCINEQIQALSFCAK